MTALFRAGRRLVWLALLAALGLHAQAHAPLVMDKQFSADQVVTTKDGRTLTTKIYMDNGKIRTEVSAQGTNITAIVLPAEQKVYSILPQLKLIMVGPYDPKKFKNPGSEAFNNSFDYVSPDSVGGVACEKFKTTVNGHTYFLWEDPLKKVPVKMAAEDGRFSLLWKNYHAGPQSAALFVVPAGYQLVKMPDKPYFPSIATPAPSE